MDTGKIVTYLGCNLSDHPLANVPHADNKCIMMMWKIFYFVVNMVVVSYNHHQHL